MPQLPAWEEAALRYSLGAQVHDLRKVTMFWNLGFPTWKADGSKPQKQPLRMVLGSELTLTLSKSSIRAHSGVQGSL